MLTRSAKLRRCWTLAHRSIGLTLGSILILAVFTGALMTVARPLDEWVHACLFRVAPQVSVVSGLPERQIEPRADGGGVLERVRQQLASEFGPGASFRLRPPQQADDSLRARVSGSWDGVVYFDPRTAVELGRRSEHQALVNLLFELHSTLLMGEAGKAILALASLAYLFLLISGLVLWWPIRWRQASSAKLKSGPTRALFDLHRVGGSLLGLLIAVSVVSGAYMAWRPLSAAVGAERGAGDDRPPSAGCAGCLGCRGARGSPGCAWDECARCRACGAGRHCAGAGVARPAGARSPEAAR